VDKRSRHFVLEKLDVRVISKSARNASNAVMRRPLIQVGSALILTLCIWGHVSEIFDRWDNTFQTANDVEYSTVIVALIAGAVIGLAHFASHARASIGLPHSPEFLFSDTITARGPAHLCGHSPPPPLRI
jgi:hypothetical protein